MQVNTMGAVGKQVHEHQQGGLRLAIFELRVLAAEVLDFEAIASLIAVFQLQLHPPSLTLAQHLIQATLLQARHNPWLTARLARCRRVVRQHLPEGGLGLFFDRCAQLCELWQAHQCLPWQR
jgi:hypothetical protein